MPFVKIDLPPGMYLNGTEYGASGRWGIGNLVRWFRGEAQPIGGWNGIPLAIIADDDSPEFPNEAYVGHDPAPPQITVPGICRGMLAWRDNDQVRWLAIGTTRGLFAFDGSTLYDITPSGLGVGEENQYFGDGYGALDYGEDDYGTARSSSGTSIVQEPGAWTLDTWGQNLIACANWKGLIYEWDPTTPSTIAAEVTNGAGVVPQNIRGIIVTNERHLVAIGAADWTTVIWDPNQRRIAWSSSEDNEDWVPTATNSAGDLQLNSNGLAICGAKFRNEILIWTDMDMHRMTYIGAPYFYSLKPIASSAGIVSTQAFVVTNEFVFWVSKDGFFVYDGTVTELESDVADFYHDNITETQYGKVACGHNPEFNEIWVFYPSNAVGNVENDSYVIWNYKENTWYIGELSRSCWNQALIWDNPVASEPYMQTAYSGVNTIMIDLNFGLGGSPDYIDVWSPLVSAAYGPEGFSAGGIMYRKIENVVVEQYFGGSTGVENTDYEVDYDLGLIKILSGGIFDTDAWTGVLVTFDIVAQSYSGLFTHEDGYTDNGADRNVYVQMHPIEIGNGDKLAAVYRVVQDTGRQDDLDPLLNSDAVEVEFDTRLAPEAEVITHGPYQFDVERGYTDVRFTGRQVVMRIRQIKNELWRIGKYRLDFKPGSGR